MQRRARRGNDIASGGRFAAIPGGDDASRPLNDRHESGDIVCCKIRIHGDIDKPRREHRKKISVSAKSRHAGLGAEQFQNAPLLSGPVYFGGHRGQNRLTDICRGPHGKATAAIDIFRPDPEGAANEDFLHERLTDQPQNRLAVAGEGDQCRPGRHAADKRSRTVDRVKNPGEVGLRRLALQLFAGNAMIGISIFNELAHGSLGRAVGLRHRVETTLKLVVHRIDRSKQR